MVGRPNECDDDGRPSKRVVMVIVGRPKKIVFVVAQPQSNAEIGKEP